MRKLAFALGLALTVSAAILTAAAEPPAAKKSKPTMSKRGRAVFRSDSAGRLVPRDTVLIPVAKLESRGLSTLPYPVPYDTSRDAALRGRVLNVPKPGTTTIAPLPAPAPGVPIGEVPGARVGSGVLPKWGDYVHVTELPEAIVRVPPAYPDSARARGIEGTVMVRALVLPDGSVAEAHASQPLAFLGPAAEACVRQWRFKPALNGTTPVAVWVGVPVKFTLH